MIITEYEVRKTDNTVALCNSHNISIKEFVNLNVGRYPGLRDNPFMLFYNWKVLLPVINNGGNTQYDLYPNEVIV